MAGFLVINNQGQEQVSTPDPITRALLIRLQNLRFEHFPAFYEALYEFHDQRCYLPTRHCGEKYAQCYLSTRGANEAQKRLGCEEIYNTSEYQRLLQAGTENTWQGWVAWNNMPAQDQQNVRDQLDGFHEGRNTLL